MKIFPVESSTFLTPVDVKVALNCVITNYAMKTYGEVEVQLHKSLTSALSGG
jgi:hypothetical protein